MFSSKRPSLASFLLGAALAGSLLRERGPVRPMIGDRGIRKHRAWRKKRTAMAKASRRANRNK